MNTVGPKEQPAYADAVRALSPALYNLPGKIVAIDGREGVGKTTLGRFLAWRFNLSLIETDLFLFEGGGRLDYRNEEINRIIDMRLSIPRPIIIEGVAVLRLLDQLGRAADHLIYVKNSSYEGSLALAAQLAQYDTAFRPQERADTIIELDVS